MIVEMQEVAEGFVAFEVRLVGSDVGPLLEHGAVEPLDLSVGLGSIGPGSSVFDLPERLGKGQAAIARAVVGEDFVDLDPVVGEPVDGSAPEGRSGFLPLVGQDL
jgi:hypothetical protein